LSYDPQLVSIRNGPGAAKLPSNVTKIHMEFARRLNDGHMGGRKFWKENLPRLKYHNPEVPMIVNRTQEQTGPATLSIYMSGDAPQQPAQIEGHTGAAPKRAVAITDAWRTIASSSTGTARAPPPAEGETVVTINMKNVRSAEILKQFLEKTGATEVEPTLEDQEEMARLLELQERAVHDKEVQKRYRETIQSEKRLLERARQEADALKADK
jgi:large subunit ribosomal protein MRP49